MECLYISDNFKNVLTKKEAIDLGLKPSENFKGRNNSARKMLKCKSIWVDSKNRPYRVNSYF